jgi:hypothetical protein
MAIQLCFSRALSERRNRINVAAQLDACYCTSSVSVLLVLFLE